MNRILCNYSPEDRFKVFEYIRMSPLLRVRGFYWLNKQEKKLLQDCLDCLDCSFTNSRRPQRKRFHHGKNHKKLLCFWLLSLLFKHCTGPRYGSVQNVFRTGKTCKFNRTLHNTQLIQFVRITAEFAVRCIRYQHRVKVIKFSIAA